MPDSKIPDLPAFVGNPTGAEQIETVQSSVSVKIPSQAIADLATIVTPLSKAAMDILVSSNQVNTYKLYEITDAVTGTARLLVKGLTTTTLEAGALNLTTGETGTYDLTTDVFTAVGGGVQSVTGDLVDNTDPLNPVVNSPLTTDEQDAIDNANAPDAGNPFATMADISGGGSSTFIGLTDVPASYTGNGLKNVRVNSTETGLEFFIPKGSISFNVDGKGGNVVTGYSQIATVPYSGLITGWQVSGDVSGTVTIDVIKSAYGGLRPTSPTNSICGGNTIQLTAQAKKQDTTLTSWTKTIAEQDNFMIYVSSPSGFNDISVTLFTSKNS